MVDFTRRDFLKALTAATAGLTVAGKGRLLSSFSNRDEAFELLVVGDSVIWGQGLDEKNKFYTLTKEWLEGEAFAEPKTVNLKVKAHSGSTLKFHPEEAEVFKKAGREETYLYGLEVNVAFPSIWKQIEIAAYEYRAANSHGADLIMLTGGITDITVAKVLDPFGKNEWLHDEIKKYCRDHMYDVLEHTAATFPAAKIAVIGYFPMIGPKTPRGKLFNNWLESMSYPRPLKPIVNNALTRQFFKKLHRKGIARSRIWFEESNRNFQEAVDRLNAKLGKRQAIFIKSPITEDQSLETKDTLLFRMGKKGRVEDSFYDQRKAECRKALPELKASTGIKYPVRLCEIAAIGHPNPGGSRAYAYAIKNALKPVLNGAIS